MRTMIKRNLTLFFRDKPAVFFSLLAVIIILGVYALFLGGSWQNSMEQIENPENLMNSWLAAGILAVASVTTTMGAFGVMIEDKSRKISKDFNSSPIRKSDILFGYLGSSFVIGMIMTLVTALLAQGYMIMRGGELLSIADYGKIFLLILLTALMNTSMVCFIVSLFKSQNAFSTASTIIGTLIGFLTGIYLPIGSLPEAVQTLIKVFPVTHAAVLFRQILMKPSMEASFSGVPVEYVTQFKQQMGVTLQFGSNEVTPALSVAVLILTTIVFCGLSLFRLSKKRAIS